VLEQMLALGSPPLVCQYRYEDGLPEPVVAPPQEPGALGYSLSVRREPLDHLLVRRASALASVDFREQTVVTDALADWLRGTASEADALGRYHRQRNDPGLEIYRTVTARARDLRATVAAH
jgi:hypothetical protein